MSRKKLVLLPGGPFDAYVEEFDVASAAACDWFATHLKAAARLSHRDCTPGFLPVPAHEVGDCHAIRLHAPATLKTLWRDGTMRRCRRWSPYDGWQRWLPSCSVLPYGLQGDTRANDCFASTNSGR